MSRPPWRETWTAGIDSAEKWSRTRCHCSKIPNQSKRDLYAKLGKCTKCEFFKKVYEEEGKSFDFGMKHAEA